MGDVEQHNIDEIDWENLFQNIPDSIELFTDDLNLSTETSVEEDRSQRSSEPSPDSVSHWIGELEHFLLEEDKEIEENREFRENFFSDLLLDVSDAGSSETRAINDETTDPKANSIEESEKEKSDASVVKNGDDEDPMSKKRKRQLRNRDAAFKSRERKKMYVRDLEIKSKFLEGECRRLENFLHYCILENQSLHHLVQKDRASGVSRTKQESAVLSLESLLLGSLFWLVSIACLFFLHGHVQAAVVEYACNPRGSNDQEPELVQGLRDPRNDKLGFSLVSMRRRCKAMRTRMKLGLGWASAFLFAPCIA